MSDVHLPNGKTQLIGMFASPVRTTYSPAMHNIGFGLLDLNLCYLAFDVDEDSLENAMDSVRTLNMRGCSISKPHKTDVIPYLDDITETAQLIGSVNVVENDGGRLIGHNTDGRGYVDCLKELGIPYEGSKITIVGAGGTASAIAVTLAMSDVREIAVFNAKDSFWERGEETVEKTTG